MTPELTKPRVARWYTPVSIMRSVALRPRLYLAIAGGLAALALLPASLSGNVREALAWITGGLVYLSVAGRLMATCAADAIARRAARNDDSRMVIMALILLAIASSFASIAGLLTEAKEASRQMKLLYLGLASATIVVSWAVTQVVFTLHYAHEFYRPAHADSTPAKGLDFPGEPHPDYWDFLYFATSIGATSQTSDVAIRSKTIRRLVTVHAVVSFFFNATVLALTINLAAGLI